MAFRRRERALQYLSLFKASLQSVFYSLEASKLDEVKRTEFRSIAENISATLLKYLTGKSTDSVAGAPGFPFHIQFHAVK
jgi:hypothetical protein